MADLDPKVKKNPEKRTGKKGKFVDTQPEIKTLVHEVLGPKASASTYIDSKNAKFSGDSKKERIKRALGAYYHRHEGRVLKSFKDMLKDEG